MKSSTKKYISSIVLIIAILLLAVIYFLTTMEPKKETINFFPEEITNAHRISIRKPNEPETVLQKKGIEFISSIQTYAKTGKRLVYFHGPDGILLELAQYK